MTLGKNYTPTVCESLHHHACCCVVESEFRKLLQKSEVFLFSHVDISIDELLLVSAYSYKDELLNFDDDYDMKDDDVDR